MALFKGAQIDWKEATIAKCTHYYIPSFEMTDPFECACALNEFTDGFGLHLKYLIRQLHAAYHHKTHV
jgi:hypothetical protein